MSDAITELCNTALRWWPVYEMAGLTFDRFWADLIGGVVDANRPGLVDDLDALRCEVEQACRHVASKKKLN